MSSTRDPESVLFSIENSSNISIDQIETRLKQIKSEVLDNNRYSLSRSTLSDLRIVLDTLFFILNDIIKGEQYQYDAFLYATESRAPIHLDNHPFGPGRNDSLKRALLVTFISAFNNVENAGPKFVKRFCDKLDGNCIDARTRLAFDYGLNITFTLANRIQDGGNNLSYKYKGKYFSLMAEMLSSDYWGLHFDADTTTASIHRVSGYINEAVYFDETAGIAGFIKNILVCDIDNTFLTFCEKVPAERRDLFLKVILNEKDFLSELQFSAKEQDAFDLLVWQTTSSKPGLLRYALSQPEYSNRIASLLRATSPSILAKICQSECFPEIIKQVGFKETLNILLGQFSTAEHHQFLLEILAHIQLLKKISVTELSIITELLVSQSSATWISLSITREIAGPTPDLHYIASTLIKLSPQVMLSALDMQPYFLRDQAVINVLLQPVLQSLIANKSLSLLKKHQFLVHIIQTGNARDVITAFDMIINHASNQEATDILLSAPYLLKLLTTHQDTKTFSALNQMFSAKGLDVCAQALLVRASQLYSYEDFEKLMRPLMTAAHTQVLSSLVGAIHLLADNRYPENLALLQAPNELALYYARETNQPKSFFDVLRSLQATQAISMEYIQVFVRAALPAVFQHIDKNKENISNRLMVEFLLVTNAILLMNSNSSSTKTTSYDCDQNLWQQLKSYPALLVKSIDFIIKTSKEIQKNLLKAILGNAVAMKILSDTSITTLVQLVLSVFSHVELQCKPSSHCLQNLKAYIADTKNPKRIIAAAQAMCLLSETPTNMGQLKALSESVKERHGKFKLNSSKLASHLDAFFIAISSIAPTFIPSESLKR